MVEHVQENGAGAGRPYSDRSGVQCAKFLEQLMTVDFQTFKAYLGLSLRAKIARFSIYVSSCCIMQKSVTSALGHVTYTECTIITMVQAR